jgi:beta-glucosidase
MQGGRAIAELITGQIEPVGRRPISFPRHAGQLPVFYNQVPGQHGERYADLTQEPMFVFGEGLGYSTASYSDLRVEHDQLAMDDTIRATVTLTNTGRRPMTETVQGYIRDRVTSVTWAEKELKTFTQADVQPGESVDVTLEVPVRACSLVTANEERVVEPGDFDLLVGSSSRDRDLLSAPFTVVAA